MIALTILDAYLLAAFAIIHFIAFSPTFRISLLESSTMPYPIMQFLHNIFENVSIRMNEIENFTIFLVIGDVIFIGIWMLKALKEVVSKIWIIGFLAIYLLLNVWKTEIWGFSTLYESGSTFLKSIV